MKAARHSANRNSLFSRRQKNLIGLVILFLLLYGFVFFCMLRKPVWFAGNLADLVLILATLIGICIMCFVLVFMHSIYTNNRKIVKLAQELPRLPQFKGDLPEFTLDLIEAYRRSTENDACYQLLQKQAELGVMQNQINPHFLYNTLECLRGLAVRQGAYDTAEMAELLSHQYRYYIGSGNDMQPIENELISVDNYFRIQQYRFCDRFTLVKHIDTTDRSIMDYRIPKLTLQPIIENIIKHAFKTKLHDNRILLEIEHTQSRLIFRIEDNGDGMDEDTLNRMNRCFTSPKAAEAQQEGSTSGTGIGLSNVNARIQMVYGRDYGLTAFSSPGLGTEIRIELPYEGPQNG